MADSKVEKSTGVGELKELRSLMTASFFNDSLIRILGEMSNFTPFVGVSSREVVAKVMEEFGLNKDSLGDCVISQKNPKRRPLLPRRIGFTFRNLRKEYPGKNLTRPEKRGLWALNEEGVARALELKAKVNEIQPDEIGLLPSVDEIPEQTTVGEVTIQPDEVETLPSEPKKKRTETEEFILRRLKEIDCKAGRTEILGGQEITSGKWEWALSKLLSQGEIIKTGGGRGTKYELLGETTTQPVPEEATIQPDEVETLPEEKKPKKTETEEVTIQPDEVETLPSSKPKNKRTETEEFILRRLKEIGGKAGKAEILGEHQVTWGKWDWTLSKLLTQRKIIRTGAGRGTKYELFETAETAETAEPDTSPGPEALDLKEFILGRLKEIGGKAGKTEILKGRKASPKKWKRAISNLITQKKIVRTGAGKGIKYELSSGEANTSGTATSGGGDCKSPYEFVYGHLSHLSWSPESPPEVEESEETKLTRLIFEEISEDKDPLPYLMMSWGTVQRLLLAVPDPYRKDMVKVFKSLGASGKQVELNGKAGRKNLTSDWVEKNWDSVFSTMMQAVKSGLPKSAKNGFVEDHVMEYITRMLSRDVLRKFLHAGKNPNLNSLGHFAVRSGISDLRKMGREPVTRTLYGVSTVTERRENRGKEKLGASKFLSTSQYAYWTWDEGERDQMEFVDPSRYEGEDNLLMEKLIGEVKKVLDSQCPKAKVRYHKVTQMLLQGSTPKDVAKAEGISPRTASNLVRRIRQKLRAARKRGHFEDLSIRT
jgi:hypothetical protein